MRDLHIEALVRQYGGEEGKELAECPVVREYRCPVSICICISSLGGIGCDVKHVVKKALSFLVFLCGLIFPVFFYVGSNYYCHSTLSHAQLPT